MASTLRTKAPLRAVQSFSATAVRTPAATRSLHITGAREASPVLNSYESMTAEAPKRQVTSASTRKFNTSRSMKAVKDSSTVDFAYMPEVVSFADPARSTELPQIPLLPDTHNPGLSTEQLSPEPAVIMPEISTTSLGSVVSAFTEVDANKAADSIGLVETKAKGEVGMVRQVVADMWDDLLSVGPKPAAS